MSGFTFSVHIGFTFVHIEKFSYFIFLFSSKKEIYEVFEIHKNVNVDSKKKSFSSRKIFFKTTKIHILRNSYSLFIAQIDPLTTHRSMKNVNNVNRCEFYFRTCEKVGFNSLKTSKKGI